MTVPAAAVVVAYCIPTGLEDRVRMLHSVVVVVLMAIGVVPESQDVVAWQDLPVVVAHKGWAPGQHRAGRRYSLTFCSRGAFVAESRDKGGMEIEGHNVAG